MRDGSYMICLLKIFASLQTVGWTVLHFAAKSGNLSITKQLLHKGADVELRDKVTSPPLNH